MQANPSRIWRPIWGLYCFNMPCERGLACALGVLTDIRFRNTKYTSFFFFFCGQCPFSAQGCSLLRRARLIYSRKSAVEQRGEFPGRKKKSLQLHTWVQEKKKKHRHWGQSSIFHHVKYPFWIRQKYHSISGYADFSRFPVRTVNKETLVQRNGTTTYLLSCFPSPLIQADGPIY